MIVIAGTVQIDPAQQAAALAAALEMSAASQAEPGCISYAFYADPHQAGHFFVFEEWESQADLDAHFQTPHMATFNAQMQTFGIRSMLIRRYEVSAVEVLG